MDFEQIVTKLDDIDKKYQDSANLSAKAIKELEEQQLKFAKDLEKINAECLAMQKKNETYPEDKPEFLSLGQRFVNSNNYKRLASDIRGISRIREKFSTKSAVVSTTGTGITDNYLGGVQEMAGIVGLPRRKLVIESLIPHIPTSAGSMSWVKETEFTNNAAVVAEAAQKPESQPAFEKYNVNIETVAHYCKISEQLAADAPAVEAYINTIMLYGLQNKIDNQLVSGTGTSGQLSGLLKSGNYTDYSTELSPAGTGDTLIDFAAWIAAELEDANYVPEYLILNPRDWTNLTLLKDSQKRYLLGGPNGAGSKSIWGIPVITSSSVTQGKYLMANLSLGAAILDRQELEIEMDREKDDFTKNLLTIRVERRLALAILDAGAIGGGDWELPSE